MQPSCWYIVFKKRFEGLCKAFVTCQNARHLEEMVLGARAAHKLLTSDGATPQEFKKSAVKLADTCYEISIFTLAAVWQLQSRNRRICSLYRTNNAVLQTVAASLGRTDVYGKQCCRSTRALGCEILSNKLLQCACNDRFGHWRLKSAEVTGHTER